MFGSAPGMTSRRGSLVLTSLTSALPFVPERAACGFGVISTVLVLWTHQLSLTFRSLLYFIFPPSLFPLFTIYIHYRLFLDMDTYPF